MSGEVWAIICIGGLLVSQFGLILTVVRLRNRLDAVERRAYLVEMHLT